MASNQRVLCTHKSIDYTAGLNRRKGSNERSIYNSFLDKFVLASLLRAQKKPARRERTSTAVMENKHKFGTQNRKYFNVTGTPRLSDHINYYKMRTFVPTTIWHSACALRIPNEKKNNKFLIDVNDICNEIHEMQAKNNSRIIYDLHPYSSLFCLRLSHGG